MNESLYNKIITSVSKIVKKSINEAYNKSSIYDRYLSSDELSILNNVGNIGDILQVNQFDDYRVKSANSVNESIFDDVDFEDSESSVISTLMDPYKVTKHFDNMSDNGKRNENFKLFLSQFTSWNQLYNASISGDGIEIPYIDFSLYENNPFYEIQNWIIVVF